jgi:restriction endonuclease S subunit
VALKESIKSLEVPTPLIKIQRAIVTEIEAEQALVAANRRNFYKILLTN